MPVLATLLGACIAPLALADVPRVVVDIPPVHSLVARVMGDVGRPELVMRPGASPHGYAMRPSEALALERSDVVFRTSDALTPWLGRRIAALAPGATSIELMAVPGTIRLARRTGATFSEHGPEHGPEAEHGDDEHGEQVQAGQGGQFGPGDAPEDDTPYDPHGWLDPRNAGTWLDAIAATLADADPDNAGRYAANAAAGRREIDATIARTSARLAPVTGSTFVTFHDSFAYFESRFGVRAVGALSPSDASDPGPARVREVREAIERLGIACVFAEPQFDPARVRALVDGLPVRSGTLDPIGASLEPGPTLYEQLIDGVATSMLECLDA